MPGDALLRGPREPAGGAHAFDIADKREQLGANGEQAANLKMQAHTRPKTACRTK
jgi:hypothetical protein